MSLILSSGKQEIRIEMVVMNSAGMLGFSDELRNVINLSILGAFITNPVSLHPRTPAHGSRVIEYQDLLLLHTGLPNPGINRVLQQHEPRWTRMGLPVILHALANDRDEMIAIIDHLEPVDAVQAIEVGLLDEHHDSDCSVFAAACSGMLPAIARVPITAPIDHVLRLAELGAAAIALGPPRGAIFHHGVPVSGRLYGPELVAQVTHACLRLTGMLACPLIAGSGLYDRATAENLLAAGIAAIQLDTILWTEPAPFFEPPMAIVQQE